MWVEKTASHNVYRRARAECIFLRRISWFLMKWDLPYFWSLELKVACIFFWNGITQGSMVVQYPGCMAIKFQTANDSPDVGDTQMHCLFLLWNYNFVCLETVVNWLIFIDRLFHPIHISPWKITRCYNFNLGRRKFWLHNILAHIIWCCIGRAHSLRCRTLPRFIT